jgi:integrase
MTAPVYGDGSRRPVFTGNRRVPGLTERTRKNGTTVYEVHARLGGKLRRHTLNARTKTDAITELRALQTDYARGEPHRSPSACVVTVADLAQEWLEHLEGRISHRDPRLRYSPRTVDLYRQRVEQYLVPALGLLPVAEVNVGDIRRLIDRVSAKCLAPATVLAIINMTSGLFRYGMRLGVTDRNPVRDLDRDDRPSAKRQTEPRYLTSEEVTSLLGRMTETFRPIAACCALAGLRLSEALGLTWADVDFDAKTITVTAQLGRGGNRVPTKTVASNAAVPLLPALERELRAHRSRQAERNLRFVHRDALVFCTTRGTPQSHRNTLRAVKHAGDQVGLNGKGRETVGVHDLRHSFVAIALANGLTLPEAAMLARHASPRVTLAIYAGVADNAREAAVDKLLTAGFGR